MDKVTCNELEITDPKTGKPVVTLTAATGKGPGLWLTRPNGDSIAIAALDKEMSICLYSERHNAKGGVPPLALSVDDAGRACVQYKCSTTGEARVVAVEDLARLLGK